MGFDIRTLVIVLGITHILQVIVFSLQAATNKTNKGVGWWLLWSVFAVMGFIFILLRDIPSIHLISIIAQNLLITIAVLFLYVGIMHFMDKKENRWFIFLIIAFIFIALVYFTYVDDNIVVRTIIISFVWAVISFFTALKLITNKTTYINASSNFLAVMLFVHGCYFLYRAVMVLAGANVHDMFSSSLFNVSAYLDGIIVGILWTCSLIIMVNQRSNAEMTEAKEHSELIFNTGPDGSLITSIDNSIISEVNEGFISLTGFSREELIGQSSLAINLWKNQEDRQKVVNQLREKGFCNNFESEFLRKDGSLIIGLMSAKIIILRGVPHIISVIRDISEHKQVEDSLQESESRLSEAQRMAQLGYWIWDVGTGDVKWTEEIFNIFHLDPKTFTPRIDSILSLSPWPQDHERDKELIRKAMTSHEKGTYEQRFLLPDKSIGYYHSTFQGKYDDKGDLITIVGTVLDITERKRAEEILRRHTERLQNQHQIDQTILQAIESPEAIAQTSLQHIRGLLQCQRASVGIFDMDKKEVQIFAIDVSCETIVQIGKNLPEGYYGDLEILKQGQMEIVEDMSSMTSPSAITRILQAEGIQSSINVPLVSALGIYGVLNVGWDEPRIITSEEREIAGEVAGQITIAIEKASLLKETKRYSVELEKRVLERTAQLEASNKELEAFTYSVSHDLRAPLRHISGYVDLLNNSFHGLLPEKGKHYLDSIAHSAHEMGTLIDDLLQFSRTGRQEMRQADLDMNIIFQEALGTLKHDITDRNIKWVAAMLPHVFGDHALLRLVWLNLLSNAVKYTRLQEKAMIEIGIIEEKQEFVFFVRDNGVGFDMQYAHKLFGVFQRLHSSEEFEGTGIGLANVRRIILKHGGRTWAEAELNKGATFYFSLPKNKENKS